MTTRRPIPIATDLRLTSAEKRTIQRAAVDYPTAAEFSELRLHRRLDQRRSGARVYEVELTGRPLKTSYNLACILALREDPDALDRLEGCLVAGTIAPPHVEQDPPDWAAYRNDPAFEKMMERFRERRDSDSSTEGR